MTGIRLSKLMAERGMCSRREADRFIENGWVRVDGQTISVLGTRVDPAQTITLASAAQRELQHLVTVLLNKPVAYVSGQPEKGHSPAVSLLTWTNCASRGPPKRGETPPVNLKGLAPAGRLDIDSHGLLVLTQNGRIAKQLVGSNSKIDKEYIVTVRGQISESVLGRLRHGLDLDGRQLNPAQVNHIGPQRLCFVLTQGRKRQIRRMCEQVDLLVTGLKRVRIGKVQLGRLPVGKWRYLGKDESF